VGECAVGVDVEDGERVFAVVDAAFREDDGDEVDAGGSEEWEGR
jgi:transcriptional regulator